MSIPTHIARQEFGLDHSNEPINSGDQIKDLILAINPETPKTKLPEKLQSVLHVLASPEFGRAKADAYLEIIKNHFKLTDSEIKSYQKDLKKLGKDRPASDVSFSQAELIEKLKRDKESITINPAQDFHKGSMYFAVRVNGHSYLLGKDRKLIDFEKAQDEGLFLENKDVSTFRFSPDGVIRYLERNDQVSLSTLFDEICGYIKRYIHFTDPRWVEYLALWTIGTYLFTIFGYYPYVWLNAEKQSGKSLLMKVLSKIAFNGEILINPTPAVVFRDVSQNSISMFIDEVEQFRKQDKEAHGAIISLLNNGFERCGLVKRVEKGRNGGFEIKSYSTYSPKMFAGINQIDDILQDRTVRINLLRKKDSEAVDRYKESTELLAEQQRIRDNLYIFALNNGAQVANIYQGDTIYSHEHLRNRELDIWEPIVLLANLVDEAPEFCVTLAMAILSKESLKARQEDNIDNNETTQLLTVAHTMLDELNPISHSEETYTFNADKVYDYFCKTEEFSWLKSKKQLTPRLKRIRVKVDRSQQFGKRVRVYRINRAEFQDLCERFKI